MVLELSNPASRQVRFDCTLDYRKLACSAGHAVESMQHAIANLVQIKNTLGAEFAAAVSLSDNATLAAINSTLGAQLTALVDALVLDVGLVLNVTTGACVRAWPSTIPKKRVSITIMSACGWRSVCHFMSIGLAFAEESPHRITSELMRISVAYMLL